MSSELVTSLHAFTSDRCFIDSSLHRFTLRRANEVHPLPLASALRFGSTDEALGLRSIGPYDARIVVPDFFNLVNVTNTGAAFGSFKGNNTFFVVISFIALVVVTFCWCDHRRSEPVAGCIARALLLAGILGNLTDRLLYGHVIDFLLFNLHIRYADPWPAFNVADSCISIAVVLFIIHSFRNRERQREESAGRGD